MVLKAKKPKKKSSKKKQSKKQKKKSKMKGQKPKQQIQDFGSDLIEAQLAKMSDYLNKKREVLSVMNHIESNKVKS